MPGNALVGACTDAPHRGDSAAPRRITLQNRNPLCAVNPASACWNGAAEGSRPSCYRVTTRMAASGARPRPRPAARPGGDHANNHHSAGPAPNPAERGRSAGGRRVLSAERGYRSAGVIVLVTVLRRRAPVSLGHDTSSFDSSRSAHGIPPRGPGHRCPGPAELLPQPRTFGGTRARGRHPADGGSRGVRLLLSVDRNARIGTAQTGDRDAWP
jgi:hypothetical protein